MPLMVLRRLMQSVSSVRKNPLALSPSTMVRISLDSHQPGQITMRQALTTVISHREMYVSQSALHFLHLETTSHARPLTMSAPSTAAVHPPSEFPWNQVQQVPYQAANTGQTVQACHAMIYARTDARFVNQLPFRAWVLMQMRFDGKLGFPGGIVSDLAVPDATLEEGLNRELMEEIQLDCGRFAFRREHYVVSHFCPRVNLILNLYAQEVTESEFREIESRALTAEEYGHECLGVMRIPLYTMADGVNGLPAFLQNQFAGTSVLQVMVGLVTQHILTDDELKDYLHVLPKHHSYRKLLDEAVTGYRLQRASPAEAEAGTSARE